MELDGSRCRYHYSTASGKLAPEVDPTPGGAAVYKLDGSSFLGRGLMTCIRIQSRLYCANISQARSIRPGTCLFFDCILHNRNPEPSGLEGLPDVRVIQAMLAGRREQPAANGQANGNQAPTRLATRDCQACRQRAFTIGESRTACRMTQFENDWLFIRSACYGYFLVHTASA